MTIKTAQAELKTAKHSRSLAATRVSDALAAVSRADRQRDIADEAWQQCEMKLADLRLSLSASFARDIESQKITRHLPGDQLLTLERDDAKLHFDTASSAADSLKAKHATLVAELQVADAAVTHAARAVLDEEDIAEAVALNVTYAEWLARLTALRCRTGTLQLYAKIGTPERRRPAEVEHALSLFPKRDDLHTPSNELRGAVESSNVYQARLESLLRDEAAPRETAAA